MTPANSGVVAAQALKITEVEERELRQRAGQYTRAYREVIRAKFVLLAAEGLTDIEIAARLDCTDRMVANGDEGSPRRVWRDWRRGPRPGRPRSFSPPRVAEVKALACELPATPAGRWGASRPLSCTGWRSSAGRQRGLGDDDLALAARTRSGRGQQRSWIFPRDPDFRPRPAACSTSTSGAGRAGGCIRATTSSRPTRSPSCRRCARRPLVLAAPAGARRWSSTSTAARHAGLPGRVGRPRSARGLFGRCEAKIGIDAVRRARRAGHEHRALRLGAARVLGRRQRHDPPRPERDRPARERLAERSCWSTCPIHASWLNQIEIYFSILQRKALTPAHFADSRRARRPHARLRGPLPPRSPSRSTGPSPADLDALLARLDQRPASCAGRLNELP